MSRIISFVPNEYYHVYNRGVNKMVIFNDKSDYERFQKLLYITNSKETKKLSSGSPHRVWSIEKGEELVCIGAYCLMPNHFHILIKSKNKEGTSLFLQRLQMSYSKYFNTKNNRSGALFQGKSKAEHVRGNNYLKYLFSYIHLNPVKLTQKDWKEKGIKNINKTKKYLNEYKYSSYSDFLKERRKESKIINQSVFPNYFPSSKLFEREVFEWLKYKNNETL